jgi:cardiolipin synthase
MFSVYARSRMLARGRSVSSLMLFFSDSVAESIENIRTHRGLAVSMLGFSVFFHILVLAGMYFIYDPENSRLFARLVFFTSWSFVGFTSWLLMYVGLIRGRTGEVRRTVGLANYLTLARFFLIAPVVVLFSHGYLIAALCGYIILGLTDIADGIVARRRKEQTEFGVVMDPLADVFSTAAVFAAFLAQGLVPLWLFVILMIRYGMLIVGSFVLFLAVGPIEFRATLPGKIVGVLQAVGIVIIVGCVWSGINWEETVAPVLFPLLGFIFSVIVVSQIILGYRHCRRYGKIRSKAVHVGS